MQLDIIAEKELSSRADSRNAWYQLPTSSFNRGSTDEQWDLPRTVV